MLKRTFTMLVVVSMLLTGIFQGVLASGQSEAVRYSDVKEQHWAARDITKWTQKGLFVGSPDGTFMPDGNLTRAEFCTVMNKVFGFKEESTENFRDVKSGQWYAAAAAKAKAAGYTKGWAVSSFKANTPITRKEVSMAIFNAFKLSNVDTSGYLSKYTDLKDFEGTGSDEIAAIIANGFMIGYTDKTFGPESNITRAEFTKVLGNAISELYSTAGSYSASEIKGNVIINTPGVTLKDIKIEGSIYLAEGISEGDVTLDNVTVNGKTFVSGGKNISLKYSEASAPDIIIDRDAPAGKVIDISGNIKDVICKGTGITINIDEDSVVNSLTIEESADDTVLKVAGRVDKAVIKASNVKINDKPIQQGATGAIDGKKGQLPAVNTGGTGGSGGNGGNQKPTPQPEEELWKLVWNDEFDGAEIDTSKWRLENKGDGFGNQEAQYYRPQNAFVEDGKLIMEAKKESYSGCEYTSAKLFSKADWKYGKFEAKIKLPAGQGFWPAFWMMPADSEYGGWAASGEIDIMEARGRFPGEASGTLHYGGPWPHNIYSGATYLFSEGETIEDFHTYSIEWEPGEIRWYIDGKLYQTQNNWNTKGLDYEEKYAFPAPFDKNFYLMLNLAIGGTFDGMRLPDDNMFPARMEVDYVRVYELTGRPYKTVKEPSIILEPLPDGARLPDEAGNLVKDINFGQGIKDNKEGLDENFGEVWNFIHNAQFGGVATAKVEPIDGKHYAKVDVTNKGSQPYSVQLEQHTTLGKGRWYKYSFDAKADKNRTLSTKLGGGPTAGWAAYSESYTANLTTELKHFEYVFQMISNSDILTRIEFNCATDTGPVWIGNVRLEEIDPPTVDYNATKEPLPVSGNLIYNGAFDKYTIDRMAYWNISKSDAVADVSAPEDTRELTVKITNGGASANALAVSQKGVQVEANNGYQLRFKARAESERTIEVMVVSEDGSLIYMPKNTVNLTSVMQEFEIPFNMEAATDLKSQLIFLLGGNNADVYIDDVLLVKTTIDYEGVDLYPLKNGDFSLELVNWDTFTENAAAGFSVEKGEAKVAITNVGSEAWNVMLSQGSMSFKKGIEYEFSFDARASVERYIEASIENASYVRSFETGQIQLTNETQHFAYTFKPKTDETLALKFLLGNVKDAAVGDVFIGNVILQVKNAPVKKAPTLVADTIENKVGQNVEIAILGDDDEWRSSVKAVKVDDIALTEEKYILEAGKLTLDASNFSSDQNYSIKIEAEGYAAASVVQQILPSDGNLVVNGNFSSGGVGWGFWNYWEDQPVESNVVFEDEMAKITINNNGGVTYEWGPAVPISWSTQFFQEGIRLEAGKAYELSFKAWSTENRPVEVELNGYNGNKKVAFNITDESATYKCAITTAQDVTLKIVYLLGNVVYGEQSTPDTPHTIYIDDVLIKEVLAPPVLNANSSNNKVGQDISITFAENETWRGAITAVQVGATELTAAQYTMMPGVITIDKSVFAAPDYYDIAIKATGYADAAVKQRILTSAENISLGKTATASSGNTGANMTADKAFDGDLGTRWESEFSDPQWISVDLGQVYTLDSIVICWEGARAADYEIQIATIENPGKDFADGDWSVIYSITDKSGSLDEITLSGQEARHVRLYGTKRALPYGYSIFEMEVYGKSVGSGE